MREYFLLSLLLAMTFSQPVFAQPRYVPVKDLAVDMVKIQDGPRLLGVIVQRDEENNVTLAVNRNWLAATDPLYYQERVAAETEARLAGTDRLLERITEWKEARKDVPKLTQFLDQEYERISAEVQKQKDNPPDDTSPIMLIDIAGTEIQTAYQQPPQQRQIAMLAWRENLLGVETSTAKKLYRELEVRKIPVFEEKVTLQGQIPQGTVEETPQQWAARQALVEYRFCQEVSFQGSGDMIYRTGTAAPPVDLNTIAQEMLQGALGNELEDLLQEPGLLGKPKGKSWFQKATEEADREGVTGCRVTRVTTQLASKQVVVEIAFLAKMPGGTWQTAWSHTLTVPADQARPEEEARIRQDQQVKQALQFAQQLGLGEEHLTLAIRFGAATVEAQKKADEAFFTFWDKSLEHLDSSPVMPPQ